MFILRLAYYLIQSKMKNEIFDTFSRHIWTRPSPPAGCGTLVDCPIKIILSILSEIAPRPMVKVTIHCCKKEKIVKTIRQCLYGISINVFTLIIALLTGKKFILEIDDFFQFGALISQTWHFSNFNAVRVIELGINCDREYLFGGVGGGAGGRDDRKPLRGSPALSTTVSFERKLTRNFLVRLNRGTQWISSSKYLFFRQIFAGR